MKKIYGLLILALLNISILLLVGQFFIYETLSLSVKIILGVLVGLLIILLDYKVFKLLHTRIKSSLPEIKKQKKLASLKRKKHIVNLLLSILTILSGLGNYYYFKTNQMLQTITFVMEPEELTYQVYVTKDSGISSISDEAILSIGFEQAEQEKGYSLLASTLEHQYQRINYQDFLPEFVSPRNDLYEKLKTDELDAIILSEEAKESLLVTYPNFLKETRMIQEIIIPTGVKSQPVDVSKECFNVLIMGVDIREDEGDIYTPTRTDTLMVVTFNPSTMQANLVSIPRDSYVEIAGTNGTYDKITHAGLDGIGCTIETVENLLDIEINYYAKFNFNALVNLVDTLGGIQVDVQYSFQEQDSNDVAGAINVTQGLQVLNGEQALAYARHRKTQNDHVRNESQQQVIKAILSKLASLETISKFDELMNVLANNMTTNFNREEIIALMGLIPKLNELQMTNSVLEGEDLETYVPLYDQYLWITQLDSEAIEEVTQKMKKIAQ